VLFVRKIPRSGTIGKEHRHVIVGKARSLQLIYDSDRLLLTLCDAKYSFVCHDWFSFFLARSMNNHLQW
jgi:hypothetical protein